MAIVDLVPCKRAFYFGKNMRFIMVFSAQVAIFIS